MKRFRPRAQDAPAAINKRTEPHHQCIVAPKDSGRSGYPLMGQKESSPHGFRLGITTDHKSRWFAELSHQGESSITATTSEDVAIRRLMAKGMGGRNLPRGDQAHP